jgi:hypothetical protein
MREHLFRALTPNLDQDSEEQDPVDEIKTWYQLHIDLKKKLKQIDTAGKPPNGEREKPVYAIDSILQQSSTSCGFFATLNLLMALRHSHELKGDIGTAINKIITTFDMTRPDEFHQNGIEDLIRSDFLEKHYKTSHVNMSQTASSLQVKDIFSEARGFVLCHALVNATVKTVTLYRTTKKFNNKYKYVDAAVDVRSVKPNSFTIVNGNLNHSWLMGPLPLLVQYKYKNEKHEHFVAVISGKIYDSYDNVQLHVKNFSDKIVSDIGILNLSDKEVKLPDPPEVPGRWRTARSLKGASTV